MTGIQIFWTCFGGAIFALIAFMILRTVFTRPKKEAESGDELLAVDENAAALRLAEAVKIETVTVDSVVKAGKLSEKEAEAPFFEFHKFLEKSYPIIYARAQVETVDNLSLIIKVKGSDESLLPVCFTAHMDVVPAPSEGWEHEPFSGDIDGGYVHGRGSQDMKCQLLASLEALEEMLKAGYEPKRSIYYCFGHDEELEGKGAQKIVETLFDRGIEFEYVIDEGGTILDGAELGAKNLKIALIGTCEKGHSDFLLTAEKNGGHGSSPRKHTAVDTLAQAILDLKHIPMKAYWSTPAKQMFKYLAPETKGLIKFVLVNRDILAPLLKFVLTKIPIGNALMRTTFSFTQLYGSDAPNVIPPKASVMVNCRINIGQNLDDVRKHIKKVVGKNITVTEPLKNYDPSEVSPVGTEIFDALCRSIRAVFKGYACAPYPFIASSDAKYYYKVSKNVFRFTPFAVTQEDQNRIHAKNERCEVAALKQGVQFFAELIKKTC